jgi:aspartyl-tRNA(Asn)/glutamyl-tRNA(Gln) amidotransferase subunit C
MKIAKNQIINVANLARLDIDDKEIDGFADQISQILEYVDTLNQVETKGVKPTSHAIFLTNAFREDDERKSLDINNLLANAPETENGNFVVPKVIE